MGRKPGEALCPELGKDAKWLAEFKRSYLSDAQGGARAWMALYQCSPRVEGGNLVRRDWWRFYDPKAVTSFGTEVISVDAAFKGAEDNDFVAITVWGKRGNVHMSPDPLICNEYANGMIRWLSSLPSVIYNRDFDTRIQICITLKAILKRQCLSLQQPWSLLRLLSTAIR